MNRRFLRQACRFATGLFLALTNARAFAQFPPPDAPTPASAAARLPAPDGARPYGPGVYIDWEHTRVLVDAVSLGAGPPIEFLACFPGKSHESLLLIQCSARNLYEALGLAGFEPGRPPQWDTEGRPSAPASGDLVDVQLECLVDGGLRRVDGFEWLVDLLSEQNVAPRAWVFSGSLRRSDGSLAADITGEGFALVDMPGALFSLSRRRASRDGELWAAARPGAIPAAGTPVRIVLSRAAARTHALALDQRGDLRVNGRITDVADVIDLVVQCRRLAPAEPVSIWIESPLKTDAMALLDALRRAEIGTDALKLERPASQPSGEPLSRP